MQALCKQVLKVGRFQREIGQEEVYGPQHSDDVHMTFTIALAPNVVNQIPQTAVCILCSDLKGMQNRSCCSWLAS